MITGLLNVFPVVRESVVAGAMITKCVKMSSKCCALSCNWNEIRAALCFLKKAAALRGRFSSTLIFQTSNLEVAEHF